MKGGILCLTLFFRFSSHSFFHSTIRSMCIKCISYHHVQLHDGFILFFCLFVCYSLHPSPYVFASRSDWYWIFIVIIIVLAHTVSYCSKIDTMHTNIKCIEWNSSSSNTNFSELLPVFFMNINFISVFVQKSDKNLFKNSNRSPILKKNETLIKMKTLDTTSNFLSV